MNKFFTEANSIIDSFFIIGKNRVSALDGVRALAITLVIMRHCFDRPLSNVKDIPSSIQYIMSFGWVGVHLFFVLSGFLIGGMIYKQIKAHNFSFRDFYIKRIFRIMPVAYVYLLIVHWELVHFNIPTLYNFLFINNYLGFDFTSHFWSLNVEEHFYLFFPLSFFILYKLFNIHKMIPVIVTTVAAVWVIRIFFLSPSVYTISHWQIDYFLLGVLASILYIEDIVPQKKFFSALLWLIPVFYAVLSVVTVKMSNGSTFLNQNPVTISWLAPLYSLFSFAFVILVATQDNLISRFLSLRVFRWIGILSYSMYIWHLFIITHYDIYRPGLSRLNPSLQAMIVFLIYFSLTTLVAFVSYQSVEKPFLMIRDRILSGHRDDSTIGVIHHSDPRVDILKK